MSTKEKPDLNLFKRYRASFNYGFWLEIPGVTNYSTVPDSEDWLVLNLNPQSYDLTEPAATAVAITQGGGKFVESRGGVLKQLNIGGTTGYLPTESNVIFRRSISKGALLTGAQAIVGANKGSSNRLFIETEDAENERAERSGFAAWHRLNYLFRRFLDMRRAGKLVLMHFFNLKDDEYWQVEPVTLRLSRNSRDPMSYRYTISLTLLDPTNASVHSINGVSQQATLMSTVLGDDPTFYDKFTAYHGPTHDVFGQVFAGSVYQVQVKTPSVTQATARLDDMKTSGLAYIKLLAGKVQRDYQRVLGKVGDVLQIINDVADTTNFVLDTVLNLLRLTNTQLDACFDTVFRFAPSNVQNELNDWLLEAKILIAHMTNHFVDHFGGLVGTRTEELVGRYSQMRHTQGSTTDLLKETGKPLSTNPFVGIKSYEAVMDSATISRTGVTRPVEVLHGQTIYDIARQRMGNVNRFVDLVLINQLDAPYIVESKVNKPSRTLAWGEYIQIPDKSGAPSRYSNHVNAEPANGSFLGTVSEAGISTEVRDLDLGETWQDDQWVGFTVTMLDGPAFVAGDYTRVIVANNENTLIVNRPWSVFPDAGDSYMITMVQFEAGKSVTPETKAYGRDLILRFSFQTQDTLFSSATADVLIGQNQDLMMVQGLHNFQQAVTLRVATERGRHTFHENYGFPLPLGKRGDVETLSLYTFFARQSLMSDPRVEEVTTPVLVFEGGALQFQASIRPIAATAPVFFNAKF